jgi:hypothetical protein
VACLTFRGHRPEHSVAESRQPYQLRRNCHVSPVLRDGRRPRPGDKWHLNDGFIRIQGVQHPSPACCGSGRRPARDPRSASAGCQSCETILHMTIERSAISTSCDCDRQTKQLRRGAGIVKLVRCITKFGNIRRSTAPLPSEMSASSRIQLRPRSGHASGGQYYVRGQLI